MNRRTLVLKLKKFLVEKLENTKGGFVTVNITMFCNKYFPYDYISCIKIASSYIRELRNDSIREKKIVVAKDRLKQFVNTLNAGSAS